MPVALLLLLAAALIQYPATAALRAQGPGSPAASVLDFEFFKTKVQPIFLAKREGRTRWNYLNAAPLKEIYDRWISSYAGAAVDLLARMKREMDAD